MKKIVTLVLALTMFFVFSACENIEESEPNISEERMTILLAADNLLAVAAEGTKNTTDTVYNNFINNSMDNSSMQDLSSETLELLDEYFSYIEDIDTTEYPELLEYRDAAYMCVANGQMICVTINSYILLGNAEYINDIVEYGNSKEDAYNDVIQERRYFFVGNRFN